jgi:DNA-binding PadR family transcriptional regulator
VSIRHALLAILDQGPCYGNQLRTEYSRRTGDAWPLNVGQIYTTLDRLERDGLVRTGDRDAQGHLFYEISPAGREEVHEWFHSPLEGVTLARDDVATMVALAVTLPGVDAAAVLRVQHSAAVQRAAALRASQQDQTDSSAPLAALIVLDARTAAADAEVTWLSLALARLAAAGDSSGVLPLDTVAPRRGRPPGTPAAP